MSIQFHSDPGVVSDLSFLIERSINVPGENRFVKGIKDDVVLFGVVFVHEVSSCSCVEEDRGVDGFIFFCCFALNGYDNAHRLSSHFSY